MTTQTQTLASWLLDRIAEDETVAEAARRMEFGYPQAIAHTYDGQWRVRGSYGEPDEEGCTVEGTAHDDPFVIHDEGGHTHEQAVHIARHDPARVLADCAAKRQIVELHADQLDADGSYGTEGGWYCYECGHDRDYGVISWDTQGCLTLRALSQPYRDSPGWQESWSL